MTILKQSMEEAEQVEQQIQKARETEQQMLKKMKLLQDELESVNRKLEIIQKGSGYGARANSKMNFGSDYSGGSRNSSNKRTTNLQSKSY
jgi:hypothetical protein